MHNLYNIHYSDKPTVQFSVPAIIYYTRRSRVLVAEVQGHHHTSKTHSLSIIYR